MLDFITWTADPVWFHIGPLAIRWYSLAFMVGFLVGYEIESRIYRHEGAPEKWLGILLMWTVAGTIALRDWHGHESHRLIYEKLYW